jgi:peptide/nickel transport system substrate-binding protein
MKRLLFILIAITLISGLILAGCGGSTPASTTQGQTSLTTSAPAQSTGTQPPPSSSSTTAPTSATTTTAPAGSQQYGGVLRVTPLVSPGGPIGWPPENIGEMANLQQFAYEPLIRLYFDGTIEPRLATKWEASADGLSYTFYLRKGVKFHDGTDFNAQAVKFNFDAMIEAKTFLGSYLKSVDVLDDYTVKINVNQPNNTIFSIIGGAGATIVSPTAYEKNGVEWMRNNMVGTGPFILKNFTRDVSAEFVRNPDYWAPGQPYLDGIKVIWIADPLTASAALRAGDIDAMQVEVVSIAADLKQKGFAVDSKTSGMVGLIFDSANPDSPFADKRVRQAVEYALNKEALVKAKGYGYWHGATQLPPVGTAAYDPNFVTRQYDPEKAKQLLADAGYPDGFKWRLVVAPLGIDRDIATGIQNYLSKVGIDISLEFPVYSKYLEYRQISPWSGAILMQPMLMPSNFNQWFSIYMLTSGGIFKSLQRPQGLEDGIYESLGTPEPDVAKIKELSDMVYEDATVIPLYNAASCFVYNPDRVHDAGFDTLDDSFSWTPWKAWKGQ